MKSILKLIDNGSNITKLFPKFRENDNKWTPPFTERALSLLEKEGIKPEVRKQKITPPIWTLRPVITCKKLYYLNQNKYNPSVMLTHAVL